MYVDSLSRVFLTFVLAVVLTACGGGGSGGGGTILNPNPDSGDGDGSSGNGSIVLSISGLGDDNVLAGNEFATLTAEVVENGSAANVVVLFETSIGRLIPDSAQSSGGTANVEITGDGTAGAATVKARATLSGGLEVEDEIVVQMSSDSPTLKLFNAAGAEATTVELRAAETAVITARVEDWDGTAVEGVGVNFEFLFNDQQSLTTNITSGATNANGELDVTITGTQTSGTGTFMATAAFSEFELEDSFPVNGLGVNTDQNNIALDMIDVGADGVLAGNEKTMVVARVVQDGVAKNGIVVQFSMNGTGGSLSNSSATSANNGTSDGVAMVQLIGDATPGTATVTVSATLGNGIDVSTTQTVQTSGDGPSLSLEARDAAGNVVTTFGANQNLTLEATIVNADGSALDADDAGVNVTFDAGGLGTIVNSSDVTEFAVCPVNGIKTNADCAWVAFTSNATAAVGQISVSAMLNGIMLIDDLQVTNTGINSGTGDQDSFSISRVTAGGQTVAIDATYAIEGDQFNDRTATVDVDLADFFNNPVPDGTLIEFRTELGDIDQSCLTVDGTCSVTFTSADPRTPIDAEVSFKNLDDDNCPSRLIVDETSTVASGRALTDFRVSSVRRVVQGGTTLAPGSDYNGIADGIECLSASCTGVVEITYDRLWLDEVNDGSTAHVIAQPGQATEPFLDVTGTPCLAPARTPLQVISGSIDPDGTSTVIGVNTEFQLELAVGDRLKVNNEVRTVTSITNRNLLTVDAAFTDGVNDVTPQRMAAPAYLGGMGQPYGGRSTILALAVGEESFIDTNGNKQYDYGERFDDLPEVFMDKNEDGVLGDFDGDSAAATGIGPYSDGGLGGNPAGGKRDKSSPFCYGPKTIVGDPAGPLSSTEQNIYCYQNGGEEEFFIDNDGDNLMDLGNGIYNGSRCLRPMQDADGDGLEDDVVCTTDLVNISRSVNILMAGSTPRIGFRTADANGGANGSGELIVAVEGAGGDSIANTIAPPADWVNENTTAVLEISTQKGADVNTGLFAIGNRDVELVTIPDAITDSSATWTLQFSVTRTDGGAGSGGVEVFAAGQRLNFDVATGTCGNTTETCVVSDFTVASTGDLIIASEDSDNALAAEINDFVLTGSSTGLSQDYRLISGDIEANDGTRLTSSDMDAFDEEFDVGNDIDSTTVIRGVSERLDRVSALPQLSTSISVINAWHTDRYNGQLPDGTTVKVESDNSAGCTIASVNGITVNSNEPGPDSGSVHSETVTVGTTTSKVTTISLSRGFGTGTVFVTVTTPSGTVSVSGFSCSL